MAREKDRIEAGSDGELSAAEMEQVAGGITQPQLQLQTDVDPNKILVGLLLPAVQKVRS